MTHGWDAPDVATKGLTDLPERVDVLVIGAGLSGIGAAYRIAELNPEVSYVVLEGREATGGTWDLFRYPGVRSDSDMYTLSLPFYPWTDESSIADGDRIRDYLRRAARDTGVAERIHTGCPVVAMSWSTDEQVWTLRIEGEGGTRELRARWVHVGAGYYDYDEPHNAGFVGVEDFAGQVVHPQHWPDDLSLAGKRVLVIGSGATAVSLVPAAAQEAASVTMLQRTPSYVFGVPGRDALVDRLRGLGLSAWRAGRVGTAKNVAMQGFLYRLSRVRPAAAKKVILGGLRRELPEAVIQEHFTPPYDVWDQRLCAVRDGDLFEAICTGAVEIVTGHVDRFEAKGVRLTDGRLLEADVIVTATGLRLKALGGIAVSVDGEEQDLARTFAYRGVMLSGVPNLSMTVGYINASWTLRADLVSRYVARMLRHLRGHGYGVAVPVAPPGMRAGPVLDVTSGYVQRAVGSFPKVGDREPWTIAQSYTRERWSFGRADLSADMTFIPTGQSGASLPSGASAPATLDLPGSSSNTDGSLGDQVVEVTA
ncbi:NAD(P)/FAD-dependent oxidoreductase [Marihabitans asiaticum]|uniref:Cation diffusion facilitator CzcD-associated flavoprotein CzcO n=1 Tax=Marihabitans asiaticum TaxID=415218 RepID=A0A560WES3_9MICO|nr:NAD(P)/FAD-dependent oxidoreductase [Marihabitans asiaticum]TWD16014.1 cation diffusion facilitator CzcD-associated flavoprotein CzcO [Marihabitans asiaticum]